MDRRPGRAGRRDPDPARALTDQTTFVVTGAAGSIVAAITADLAAASGGTFHLLDLVPEPDPDDPDIERFAADRDGLKRELADRIKDAASGPRRSWSSGSWRASNAPGRRSDALEAIRKAGGTAHWHQATSPTPPQVAAGAGPGPRERRRRARSTPQGSRSATSCPTSRRRSTTWSST